MKVVAETFDLQFSGTVIERDGKPVAGVAWADLDDMFGRRRVTLPFSDYSDLIADTAADRDALLAAGRVANIPWLVRSHDSQLGTGDACGGQREFVHHVIDVTPSVDDLGANLSSMARRNTRKAENGGVEIFEGTTKDHLQAWVDLHRNLRREKYHLIAQPFSFFENIWDEFIAPGDGFLLLAANNGEIIAGTVYVNSGDTCYYKFNASSADGLRLRPNNALMWQGMLRAKERGFNNVDLGRTSVSQPGLAEFKASYGGVPSSMVEYRFLPAGYEQPGSEVQARSVISQLTSLLTDPQVPDSVIEQASNLLYRYFA
ncbi:MAG: GNAT family N-acetyltransferase [Chloroflexi bacterium]|nr:GNAT family N-acetyltransferase [Chloroflexota bacterium]